MKPISVLALLINLVAVTSAQPAQAQRSGDPLLVKLQCRDRVKDVAFSPDGKLLAAGFGWDSGGVRIWNVADRKVVANLKTGTGDHGNIQQIAFSPDGKLLAAANWNGEVLLWTVGAWNSRRTILDDSGSPESLTFSPDSTKLAYVSKDALLIYDFASRKKTTLVEKTKNLNPFVAVAFSPEGNSLIVFAARSVETWDIETRKPIKIWKAAGAGFFGDVSADGKFMIAGGGPIFGAKLVEIWNTSDETKVGSLGSFRSGLFGVAISHSAKLFAISGGDYGSGGDLSLWTVNDPQEVGFASFGAFPIQTVAFSPDDKLLAAGSDDGFVLLYDVDRLRGPHVKKQSYALCGQTSKEDRKFFMVPLSKVPNPMDSEFNYSWRLEVVNASALTDLNGLPVAVTDWDVESSSDRDRVRINKFESLLPKAAATSNHIIFGDVQNPGWDKGFVTRIYGDGSFVAANNVGKCLAYGRLDQVNSNFESVAQRLVDEGLLSIPKEPLVLGADHYRTRFVELRLNGAPELRSDADSIEVLLKGGPAKKREAFARIFDREQSFIDSLLKSGMKLPSQK